MLDMTPLAMAIDGPTGQPHFLGSRDELDAWLESPTRNASTDQRLIVMNLPGFSPQQARELAQSPEAVAAKLDAAIAKTNPPSVSLLEARFPMLHFAQGDSPNTVMLISDNGLGGNVIDWANPTKAAAELHRLAQLERNLEAAHNKEYVELVA